MRPLATLAASTALAFATPAVADPTELRDYVAMERPQPNEVITYGAATSQAIDVFLPDDEGPHPVAIMIHGGCWSNIPGAGREQLRHMGLELARRGVAAWSIGYRRADESGGGYPGTFEDVAAAIDMLPKQAERLNLDLAHSVMIGHSAGGHLALWAAARPRLSRGSRFYQDGAFVPGSVISLAGIGDLEDFSRFIPVICGPQILPTLIPQGGDHLREISPAHMPAPAVPVLMVSAALDRLVPPYVAHDYVRAMRTHAAAIEQLDIADAGHFDLVMPGTLAWEEVILRIVMAVGGPGWATE